MRFEAFGRKRDFINLLYATGDDDIEIGARSWDRDVVAQSRNLNEVILAKNAYFSLLTASDDVTFNNLVSGTSSPGKAYAAILKFYKPKTAGDIAHLHRKLCNTKKKGQRPSELFVEIKEIAQRIGEIFRPIEKRSPAVLLSHRAHP